MGNKTQSQQTTTSWQTRAKKRFFRIRPDGIGKHENKQLWYLFEFKRTSDVTHDYIKRKEDITNKKYESFMNILRKNQNTGWTSE